jgi:hypothetical protein
MPKREISRRTNAAGAPARFTRDQMLAQVLGDPSRECVAIDAAPMLPPLMRCVGGCGRCADLMAKYLAAAPVRERARQEYEATNPMKVAEAAHRDGP